MGFGTFTPKTEMVQFPGGEFAVRGLSLEDFTVLLRKHYEPAKAIFDRYVNEAAIEAVDSATNGTPIGLSRVQDVVMEALEVAPALLADVIARAADETERPEMARYLPMGVQVDAVEKIVRLTLEAEGGVEKLAESVRKLVGSLADLNTTRSP